MIAVIADDFTGAAEIGGIGVRHGLSVTILNEKVEKVATDILIIATDTRSENYEESGALLKKITKALVALHPDFIYKKVDSLLRGNVGEELLVQLRTSKKARALIIPANPALNRTIENGIYYFDGIALEEHIFSNGSIDNRKSSKVQDLIGEGARPFVEVRSPENALPDSGLIIGNTSNNTDLNKWVKKLDSQTIPSGSSGFFDALLKDRYGLIRKKQTPVRIGEKIIYVCGSAFLPSRQVVRKAREAGHNVIYMPSNLMCVEENDRVPVLRWAAEIIQAFKTEDKIILAIDEIDCDEVAGLPLKIKSAFAEVIVEVLKASSIDELMIEGGATAYTVVEKLQYKRFFPVQELGPGVIRMKVEENKNIHLTLKPGSYQWPKSIWQF